MPAATCCTVKVHASAEGFAALAERLRQLGGDEAAVLIGLESQRPTRSGLHTGWRPINSVG